MLEEAPISIAVNGVRRALLSCSPHDAAALGAGHMLAEGWIRSRDELLDVRLTDARRVDITIDDRRLSAALELRAHQLSNGCGVRHILDCDDAFIPRASSGLPPTDMIGVLRALFAAADAASTEGGLHAVALADGTNFIHATTDVTRHCAVDRVLGMALLAGTPMRGLGLVLTARISGAMALKAAHAKLSWIASRSIATSLAHEIADACGLTLIERAARRADA
jgi:FdhD protein